MLSKQSGESMDPDESYAFIKDMVERSELPPWVNDEMEKLWNNPEGFESGETLNEEMLDNPLYLIFRLGVGFGTEYERKYPGYGDWRSDET